eukprot:2430891-Alexandrium_andersonii.AAC.1
MMRLATRESASTATAQQLRVAAIRRPTAPPLNYAAWHCAAILSPGSATAQLSPPCRPNVRPMNLHTQRGCCHDAMDGQPCGCS